VKITQDVRDYAEKIGVDEIDAIKKGMKQKSEEFDEKGREIYQKT